MLFKDFSLLASKNLSGTCVQPGANAKIMSRITLTSRIDDAAKEMKIKMIKAIKSVDYITTTTDCWSARRCSFMGVKAHWLDPERLKRVSGL